MMLCGVEVGRFMFRVGKEPEAEALAKAGTLPIVFNGAADGRSRLGRRGGLSRPRSCRLDRTRLAFCRRAAAEVAGDIRATDPAVGGIKDREKSRRAR